MDFKNIKQDEIVMVDEPYEDVDENEDEDENEWDDGWDIEEGMDDLYNVIDKWYEDFYKSEFFNQLTEDEKEESYFIISNFAQLLFEHEVIMPEDWDRGDVRDCLLELFPRKLSTRRQTFVSTSPVMIAFFNFLGENGLLSGAPKLADAVRDVEDRIVPNSQDRRKWGMSKTLMCEYITGERGSGNEEELKDVDPDDPFAHIELGVERMKRDIPHTYTAETGSFSVRSKNRNKAAKAKRKEQKKARKKNLKKKK